MLYFKLDNISFALRLRLVKQQYVSAYLHFDCSLSVLLLVSTVRMRETRLREPNIKQANNKSNAEQTVCGTAVTNTKRIY